MSCFGFPPGPIESWDIADKLYGKKVFGKSFKPEQLNNIVKRVIYYIINKTNEPTFVTVFQPKIVNRLKNIYYVYIYMIIYIDNSLAYITINMTI